MWISTYNGVEYSDPKAELAARATAAQLAGDTYASVPVELILMTLNSRQCKAKTVVNGNREKKILIEVQCEREVDPVTGRHPGMHSNGKANWG